MRSHYALRATIRYYGIIPGDVRCEGGEVSGSVPLIRSGPGMQSSSEHPFEFSRWKEPPHVFFANLNLDDSAAVRKFTRQYGYLYWRKSGSSAAGNRAVVDMVGMSNLQENVRDAWRGFEHGTDALAIDLDLAELHLSIGAKGNELRIESLRTLLVLLLLQDCAAEKMEVCSNPDCPAPYFLKVRKGQNFCSRRCAVLINVRRFREREKRHNKRRVKP